MYEFEDLRVLVQAKSPLIVIETYEELRALALIKRLAINLMRPVFQWTITDGLQRTDRESSPQAFNIEPSQLLAQIKGTRVPGIYVLCDFHPFLTEPRHIRFLKEIAQAHETLGHTLILLSYALETPPELARLSYRFQLSLPGEQQIRQMINEAADKYSREHGQLVAMAPADVSALVQNLVGLTFDEARRLAYKAVADDGAITQADLPRITRARFSMLQSGGTLSQIFDTKGMDDVIGLTNFKRWLAQRQHAFRHNGADTPKGILLTGVQGSGKSLTAKAIAGAWAIPLLRLDMAALYNKYIGETEKNLSQALAQADAMAPCVLWIDEIEKGLAGGDNDNGVTRRILGTLLTWMAERTKPVFLVATANNIDELTPELLRKGRFDEIFFVDLPDDKQIKALLGLHLQRRQLSLSDTELDQCVALAQGFSGAELEQAVVSASYRMHTDGGRFSLQHLMAELNETQPLSIVMAERINSLRRWAEQRCVMA